MVGTTRRYSQRLNPLLGVVGGGEQRLPPVVVRVSRAGQGVAGVELVAGPAVFVACGVALGLVPGQLAEQRLAVDGDGLLEQGAGGGPELVAAAAGLALLSSSAPGQRLGGVAVAAGDDAAVASGAAARGRDDAAAGGGLDLVEVGAAPGAVGCEGLDPGGPAGDVNRQVGEHASLAAGRVGVEVADAEDDPVVGEWGPDRGDGELGAPDDPVDSALAVTLAGGVLPHWPQLAGGLVDTLGLEGPQRAGEHLAVQADDVVAPVVAG
ncbi:MAG: hypothetical protein WKF73_07615 [Nocardioidaceae bacterium]